jgi:hypothetical protein
MDEVPKKEIVSGSHTPSSKPYGVELIKYLFNQYKFTRKKVFRELLKAFIPNDEISIFLHQLRVCLSNQLLLFKGIVEIYSENPNHNA